MADNPTVSIIMAAYNSQKRSRQVSIRSCPSPTRIGSYDIVEKRGIEDSMRTLYLLRRK